MAGIHTDEQLGPITFHISLTLHPHFILLPFSIPSQWPPHHMQLLPKGCAILWPYTPDNISIPDSGCILAPLCLLPQPRMPRSPISASWYTSYPSVQVCHYLHPTDFYDHPGVTTDPSPLHVSTVFCIHHFALKFPIPGSPTTSELHLPEGRSHLLFILEASYIGLNSVPPQIQVFPRTPECNLMWK